MHIPHFQVAFSILTILLACSPPQREQPAEDCANQVDDDENGAVDCNDLACQGTPACTAEVCGNLLDDDGDGRFDCADVDCEHDVTCIDGLCGNAFVDPGEDCDGSELAGLTCVSQGFVGGTLTCVSCRLDTGGCTHVPPESCNNAADDDQDGLADCADSDCASLPVCTCGNGQVDRGEVCDGPIPEDFTCQQFGFPGGTLACTADCSEIDTSGCIPPVCGDGMIHGDEMCDDGNTTAGDGCDPACQVEIGPICASAKPLAVGQTTDDFASGSTDGLYGFCVGFAREKIYTYTPETSGTLTIVLNAEIWLGLYVRGTCADADTELVCASGGDAGVSPAVHLQVSAGVPLTVVVDGYLPDPGAPVAGDFTLIVVQSP